MKIIITILILVLSTAVLSEVNRFPNINSHLAEQIAIEEGVLNASIN